MCRSVVFFDREYKVDGPLVRKQDGQSAERKPVRIRKGEWCVVNPWNEVRGDIYHDRLAAIAGIVADGNIPVREFGVSIKDRALGLNGRRYR